MFKSETENWNVKFGNICWDVIWIQSKKDGCYSLCCVGPVWPVPRVEHVWHQIVLVLSVYQLGCIVASEPAVHVLSAAEDPPVFLHHRHRALLHLQDGRRFTVCLRRKLCQAHLLIQELTWKKKWIKGSSLRVWLMWVFEGQPVTSGFGVNLLVGKYSSAIWHSIQHF